MKHTQKLLSVIMALIMIITCLAVPTVAAPASAADKPAAEAVTAGGTIKSVSDRDVTIMVALEGTTTYMQTSDLQLAAQGYDAQMAALAQAQRNIEKTLSTSIEVENRYSLLFNGFSFTGESWMVDAINEMDGVSAFVAPMFELVEPETSEEVNLTPSMSMSTNLVGADVAWDLGYTGEGMVVAVIDSGIRQTHEAFSVMPENGKIDLAYLRDIYAEYGDVLHAGSLQDINDIYYNAKMPFNWDYYDGDATPNHTYTDHGTHVSGIVAGNSDKGFRGVAPDAQIATFQVFTPQGGASFDTLMLAMEDSLYLGVDAINMSLGLSAFFTSYEAINAYLEDIYAALEAAGISVVCAAGNDFHTNIWNNYGDFYNSLYLWSVNNLDVGTIGAPATFPGSFAVGSVVNTTKAGGGYLNVAGVDIYPGTVNSANTGLPLPTLGELQAGEHEMVYIGLGTPEEIAAAGGVEGKIALVQRGTLTFSDKCTNAANAGAIAVILFNNVSGRANPSVHSDIPFGNISMEEGLDIIATFANGVSGKVTVIPEFGYGGVTMAQSSSWGTTADLKIKPEISAPGDNITSAIGFGENYGLEGDAAYQAWSGTSMATPHIAGGILLIKQRLREEFPAATAAEINELAYAFMMSTAHQVGGAVRQQGAGLMDVESALKTDAYLSVPGADRPKLELDDSENGEFTFTFEVHNIGQTDLAYEVKVSALTEEVLETAYSGTVMGDRNYNAETGYNIVNPETVTIPVLDGTQMDVSKLIDVAGPKTVNVPAGETVTVNMTIACSDELMQYFADNCPVGMYLEGFVKLLNKDDGADLSVPYLGFVGDWDYAPMFDAGYWWNLPYGENNMAQSYITQGTYLGYGGYGANKQGLGLNPYWDEFDYDYLEDRNAISPNGDDYLDTLTYMEFSLMRNPRNVKLYAADAEGNVIAQLHDSTYSMRKEYFTGFVNGGPSYSTLTFNLDATNIPENETIYIVLEAYLDHEEYAIEDNMNGRQVFPVTIDTTAPAVKVVDGGIEIVDAQYTAYYAIYADAEKTELICENGVFASERAKAEFVEVEQNTFYVVTADYARNEGFYLVENGMVYDLGDADIFYGGKTVVGRQHIDYAEGYYKYGWLKYNSETAINMESFDLTYNQNEEASEYWGFDYVSAGIGVDGTVYVASAYNLYTQNPETLELTLVGGFHAANKPSGGIKSTPANKGEEEPADTVEVWVKNIFSNPVTGELYVIGDLPGTNVGVGKLDPETAFITPLWSIGAINGNPNFGNFYWAACMVDEETVAIFEYTGCVGFYNVKNGAPLYYIDLNLMNPGYGSMDQAGIAAHFAAGSMLYNEDNNDLYLYCSWLWLGYARYDAQGYIRLDLDTGIATIEALGNNNVGQNGLYFLEDAQPKAWYAVYQLIEAIGEVTLDSGDAIKAAREAYNALSAEDKARVENYMDLLMAEHDYAIIRADYAAFLAARADALLRIAELEKIMGESEALNAAREAIWNAATMEEIDAIMAELEIALTMKDVKVSDWYYESVMYVIRNGLMNGKGNGFFAPNANLTRAELVTVLYRMAGEPSVDGLEHPFADVAADTWYTDAVIWAYHEGVVNGISETAFAPGADITREQIAAILYRYAGAEAAEDALAGYADADKVSDWAYDAMNWAVSVGLINGMDETTLAPQGNATRAQIATILMRYCEG